MKASYLLPCPCGREIPVDTSQAGQPVRCQCGNQLEAPTLLRMKKLKPAAQPAPGATARRSRWGLRQRLVFLGLAIALPALVMAGLTFTSRPPQAAVITYAPLDSLSLTQIWQVWQDLHRGLVRKAIPAEAAYAEALKYNRIWTGVFLGVGALGALVMLSAFFVSTPAQSPAKKPTAKK